MQTNKKKLKNQNSALNNICCYMCKQGGGTLRKKNDKEYYHFECLLRAIALKEENFKQWI